MKFASAYENQISENLDTGRDTEVQQSFRKECDINHIMAKFAKTGVVSHLNDRQPRYDDFSMVSDYQSALDAVIAVQDDFMALSADVRAFFDNDPQKFMNATNDDLVKLGLISLKEIKTLPPDDMGGEKTAKMDTTNNVPAEIK